MKTGQSVLSVFGIISDCVTIYQMEVPFNTTIYKSMKEAGKLSAPVADWPTKRRWVAELIPCWKRMDILLPVLYRGKEPQETKFQYRDQLWGGADMVALGVASFGHLDPLSKCYPF